MDMNTIVVTRHPVLAALLIERGIVAEGTPIMRGKLRGLPPRMLK